MDDLDMLIQSLGETKNRPRSGQPDPCRAEALARVVGKGLTRHQGSYS